MSALVRALQSEWLKRRRSFASAAVIGGSLFTPSVIILVRLIRRQSLPVIYTANAFWANHWRSSWESMAVFFLPLGAILVTSLITQIEFKGNAWKQVHALPVHPAVTFTAKLTVILVMMIAFVALFIAGIWASGVIPSWLPGVPDPRGAFLTLPILREAAFYLVACLPIVAAQYLMALRSQNVLIPIGVGFMAWIAAIASVSSPLSRWWPYGYTVIRYLRDNPKGAHFLPFQNLHWLALAWFAAITIASYGLFVTKREKG